MNNTIPLSLKSIQNLLRPRELYAHKGCFGHVLVVGGDYGMPGAIRLAAEAALRVGAGMVSVLTHSAHIAVILNGRPELLCYGIDSDLEIVDALLAKTSVIVLGPGLGQSLWSKRLFERLITAAQPMVIDADGLNWLAKSTLSSLARNWVLSPHLGEAARLLNESVAEISADRIKTILALEQKYGGVIVLKGANSLIATRGQLISQCVAGNPGMASAGMGDLLSGVIAGLMAQGLSLWQAAQAGVLLHAIAGDNIAAKQGMRGLLASDLLVELPGLLNNL